MSEPGPMSLTATLVMAAVVIVLVVAWLGVVFRASRGPSGSGAVKDAGHPDRESLSPAEWRCCDWRTWGCRWP